MIVFTIIGVLVAVLIVIAILTAVLDAVDKKIKSLRPWRVYFVSSPVVGDPNRENPFHQCHLWVTARTADDAVTAYRRQLSQAGFPVEGHGDITFKVKEVDTDSELAGLMVVPTGLYERNGVLTVCDQDRFVWSTVGPEREIVYRGEKASEVS